MRPQVQDELRPAIAARLHIGAAAVHGGDLCDDGKAKTDSLSLSFLRAPESSENMWLVLLRDTGTIVAYNHQRSSFDRNLDLGAGCRVPYAEWHSLRDCGSPSPAVPGAPIPKRLIVEYSARGFDPWRWPLQPVSRSTDRPVKPDSR